MPPALVYFHGFLSRPDSLKARLCVHWFRLRFPDLPVHVPELPPNPDKARQVAEYWAGQYDSPPALIGSSMGGYHATACARRFGNPAVLINPFVWRDEAAERFSGRHQGADGSDVVVDSEMLARFAALAPAPPTAADRLLVLLQTGDETLDYRDAASFYKACTLALESGGSHHFDGFSRYLGWIARFLGLSPLP